MSVAFSSERRSNPTTQSVQALLDENAQLIQAIVDYQSKGKAYESNQYQQLLHRNLVYLATLADSNQTGHGSQGGAMTKPPSSVTPPSAHSQAPPPVPGSMMGGDMGSSGIPPNISTSGSDQMSNSGQSYPGMGAPVSGNYVSPATQSPPQLQHPPSSQQNINMGYPTPSNQQVRTPGPPGMSGPMPNMPQQSPMVRHPGQMSQQHMMTQGQQSQQQYLMQQRQMQYRQAASQQAPPPQQPISSPSQGNYGQPQSNAMMQGYQHQQQRYNPYRQPPQQQTLSHMPYPQQQGQMMMGQTQMGRGQVPLGQTSMGPGMGQTPMGQSPMGQTPMGQTPMGQTPMGQTPMGQTPMGQTPMGQTPMGQSPMGQTPMGQSPMGQSPMAQAGHSPMVQSPMGQPPV